MTWPFEARRKNGAVVGIEGIVIGIRFCFGEEECIGAHGLEMMVY